MKKKMVWTSVLLYGCAVLFALSLPLTVAGGEKNVPPALSLPEAVSETVKGTASEGDAEAVQASAPNAAQAGEASLNAKVNEWIRVLAKEKGFEQWNNAQWETYPLGPGTHEWLILLHGKSDREDVGYLVIGATEQGGYKIIEYGTGSYPLFSLNTLYHSLVQLELIPKDTSYESFIRVQFQNFKPERLYLVPLQAAWRLTKDGKTWYIDAKTGRELPDLSGAFSAGITLAKAAAGPQNVSPSGARILHRLEKDPFDPFEHTGWLKGKPLQTEAFDDIRQFLLLQKGRLTFSGKWFGGKAVYPLAVTGYHVWNTEGPFVRLDHDGGPRFVRFTEAGLLGHYYPYLFDRETAKNLL